jgi:prevent-host-death family protein
LTARPARSYSGAEVDAIGVYCPDLDDCFPLPIELVAGQWAVQLRLAPARNGQRAALHFAEKHRLGAVAQLAERRHGMAEAEGSNPSSSIAEAAPILAVGAHGLRNRFGCCMERAAAGAEISISRRGRPSARLCPQISNPPPRLPMVER